MGKGHRTCEVCGLKERYAGDKSLLFSKFPLEPSRCREWLKAVGNEELVHLPIEKLHDQRNVCANHFRRNDFNKKGNRLKRHSIPTLGLMAVRLTDAQLGEFPLHVGMDKREQTPPKSLKRSSETLGVDERKRRKLCQLHTQSISVPDQAASTSQQDRKVLMELSQNVSISEQAASTSQQDSKVLMELSQNVSISEQAASTSQQDSKVLMELSQNVSISEQAASTSQQDSKVLMELSQNVSISEQAASTSQQDSKVLMELSQNDPLTPRKRKLMEQLKKTKCSLQSLRKSATLIEKIESTVLKEMVTSAVKNQKRKPKGRRWTTKNKISALAIFKRSPKTYRYLQQLIPLPSVKTLQNVLKKIPLEPGINKAVLNHLKKISSKTKDLDKYCGLVFDEIALKRRLLYDVATDKVEGYEDFGAPQSGRSPHLADHGLVFMLQGIRAKFKQPIAFYFVKGTVSSQRLASIIKEIIGAVEETGFKILLTICDQGPTNMGALKILKSLSPHDERSKHYFTCDDKKVYIIYDVPHLFKSIRNNFFNYGELHMSGMKAKWAHLIKVEEKNRELLYLSKISQIHVQPKFRAKMKVKYAAQMLSNTVAAVLKLSAQAEKEPVQAEEIMQTGTIVHDLDRLFDKTNGPSCPDDVKKGRRENVSNKTDHIQVWAEYRKKLQTVRFKKPNGVEGKNVRCIEGYITTLLSLRDIWNEVSSLGFKYLNLRQLNQDALENLFGVIRQHCPTNRNPTCQSFVAALKTTVISGMTAPHNRGGNCEKDSKKLLTDFHDHVFGSDQEPSNLETNKEVEALNHEEPGSNQEVLHIPECPVLHIPEVPVLHIPEEFEEMETDLAEMEQQPLVYVSGYIASTILKNHNCIHCAKCLKIDDPEDDPVFLYIKLREWWKDKPSLTYPTKSLCQFIETAINIFENEVLPFLHYLNISKFAVTLFYSKCDPSFLSCKEHRDQTIDTIYFRLAHLLIRRQCQRLNQKLAEQEETSADSNKKAQQQGMAK